MFSTKKKRAAKVLLDTEKYISDHGWVQGISEDRVTGAVCLSEATRKPEGSILDTTFALSALYDQVKRYGYKSIIRYNDDPDRKESEIHAILIDTALKLDPKALKR